MPPSIADVARKAKVSISTVSRVLNRRELVKQETRERVEAAIREMGYHPNGFARGLMLRRSELVGLVLPDLHGEFYSEIIRGANLRARELGYNLVVSSSHDPNDTQSLLEGVTTRTFLDGVVVMVSELTDHVQETLLALRMPFVLLDDDVEGAAHDSVVIDQYYGAIQLMRHLVHRCRAEHIYFVGGLVTNMDTMARLDAYRRVLFEESIAYDESDIHHLDYEYETAYAFAIDHVACWAGEGRAVFAANDEMAAGFVDAAGTLGLRVPDDIAIVGFDDTRIARMTRPKLTTVQIPMSRMGAEAIELLCSRLSEPERAYARRSLKPKLIIRQSCGATRLNAGV